MKHARLHSPGRLELDLATQGSNREDPHTIVIRVGHRQDVLPGEHVAPWPV